MSYAAVSDVQAMVVQFGTIDGSSSPTSTQVQGWIDACSAEIDGVLSDQHYATPVTTSWSSYLKMLDAAGAAAAYLKAKYPDTTGPGETPAYAYWASVYRDGLKALRDGTSIPRDLPVSGANVRPSSYLSSNPDSNVYLGANAEPKFSMDKVF